MNRTVILNVEADSVVTSTQNGRLTARVQCNLGKLSDSISEMIEPFGDLRGKPILAKILQPHLGGNLETVLHTLKESTEEGAEYPWSHEVVAALVELVRHMGDVAAMHPEETHMLEGMAKIRAAAGNALAGWGVG